MRLTGEWKEGKIVTGNWELMNGTQFQGSFNESKPDGVGMWCFLNGNEQRGKYMQIKGEPTEDAEGNPVPGDVTLEWFPERGIVDSALKTESGISKWFKFK